jgi:hypothetical protein
MLINRLSTQYSNYHTNDNYNHNDLMRRIHLESLRMFSLIFINLLNKYHTCKIILDIYIYIFKNFFNYCLCL